MVNFALTYASEPKTKKMKFENLKEKIIQQDDSDDSSDDDSSICNFKPSSKKGKKYQVYTEEEKLKILTYVGIFWRLFFSYVF